MATLEQPTPRPKRRWLTFSLRGAFLILTIFCIWLAIVSARARNQAQAVRDVLAHGGHLRFDYEADPTGRSNDKTQPQAPEWLRRALGEEYFRKVVTVGLSTGHFTQPPKATDADLAIFQALGDVTLVELGGNPGITDAGLIHLAGLTKLRILYLYRTKIRGPGLQHLPRNLDILSLQHTPAVDEGLIHLKRLSKLRCLILSNTKITDNGLRHLSALRSLEHLQLANTDITDQGLEQLKGLKGLNELSVSGTNVTGRGLADFQKALPNCGVSPSPEKLNAVPEHVPLWPPDHRPTGTEVLEKVAQLQGSAEVEVDKSRPDQPIVDFALFDNNISDESLLQLLGHMPHLERLNLRSVLVGDPLAEGVLRFKLTFLSLDDSRLTDEGLRHIGQITTLRQLSLNDTRITDEGLRHLTGLKNLEYLFSGNTRVTESGRAKLHQALPNCQIH
jgi:Leucine-rich repeat (LRR) protein